MINFIVEGQYLMANGSSEFASGATSIKANFSFTEEWGKQRTVLFSNPGGNTYAVLLDEDDSCIVPWEVLEKEGRVCISVFDEQRITTNILTLIVNDSGYVSGDTPEEPTADIYQQILNKIDAIAAEGITDEQINLAIANYLTENPIEVLTQEDVISIVSDYINQNPTQSIDKEEIQGIVSDYITENKESLRGEPGPVGPKGDTGEQGPAGADGAKGEDGKDGFSPTATVEETSDGVLITITDKNGTTATTIKNGTDGNSVSSDILYNLYDLGRGIANGTIKKIKLIGDSITDGYGGTGYNGSQSTKPSTNTEGYCWANAFIKLMEKYSVVAENHGMYGGDLGEEEAFFDSILEEDDDLIIFLTGTNNRTNANLFNYYKSNLPLVVDRFKSNAKVLVMSGIPSTKANENENPYSMQDIADVIMGEISGQTYFLNLYNEFVLYCEQNNADIQTLFYDHVHPNDAGYLIMFKLICRALGLPLSPHIDYSQSGEWWSPNKETVLYLVGKSFSTNYGASLGDNATRISLVSTVGEVPYKNSNTGENMDYYPLEIPEGTTSITIVTPSNIIGGVVILGLINGVYSTVWNKGWIAAGGETLDISTYNNATHIGIGYKNSAENNFDSSYDTSNFSVIFN